MRKFEVTWASLPSGLVVPAGRISESAERSSTNFIQVKARAEEVLNLYAASSVPMSSDCGLAKLIENAKTLSDRWLANEMKDVTILHAFRALHLQRVADAVVPLAMVVDKKRYLTSLTAGSLDFFERGASAAKDILWELELWSSLQGRGGSVTLKDPPDIVLTLNEKTLGIACKKVYSEENFEKVLSQAVGQVEDQFDIGMVAVNIDDVTPANTVLKAASEREMAHVLQQKCSEFLRRHERHFRKYLSTRRVVAALISIHVIADVAEWDVHFNNSRQYLVWVIPGLGTEKQNMLRRFERILL